MKYTGQQSLRILSFFFSIDAVISEWQSVFFLSPLEPYVHIYTVYMVVNIKSSSEYLVFPPAVHLILADYTKYGSSCCEMLLHRHLKVLELGEHVVASINCPSCLPVEFL